MSLLKKLKNNLGDKVFVGPTDTIYGILASAFSPVAIERIFKIKGRDDNKPLIVLISAISDLGLFGIKITNAQAKFLKKHWPNKLSVEFKQTKFKHIHRGNNFNAFRSPKNKKIQNLLKKYGPLVAPSANLQGEKTVETIREARRVFGKQGENVDFYISAGRRLVGKSSTLIKLLNNGDFQILRQGDYVVKS
jgi:L-threonylcarbamoyladenylate synthase